MMEFSYEPFRSAGGRHLRVGRPSASREALGHDVWGAGYDVIPATRQGVGDGCRPHAQHPQGRHRLHWSRPALL